jgi:hypothetical protein
MPSFRKNDNVLARRDKCMVMILSTFHLETKYGVTELSSRYPNKSPIMKPNVVLDYTKYMKEVDSSEHHIASYQFTNRTKNWHRKMFFWCLEVSVVNLYLLYILVQEQCSKRPITLIKKFKQSHVESLVSFWHEKFITSGRMQKAEADHPVVHLMKD